MRKLLKLNKNSFLDDSNLRSKMKNYSNGFKKNEFRKEKNKRSYSDLNHMKIDENLKFICK